VAVTLKDQLTAVNREIALRKGFYSQWVRKRRMTRAEAEHEIAAMEAIRDTLEAVQRNGLDRERIR
jgi:hypothetical protein